ncbi:hypothetical protein NDU88_001843 [Pleurodeles waltl]|uniref:Uncharacterized protein n=1 Tax=Pleurodeles waltl TaxID=8319 RepID=A0AAV7UVU8_PLEWA|nr:hypothetical protein NDU88_001843 [Pleurodeles waltl]
MYRPHYYKAPIRQLFRVGTNAIKSTAETVHRREATHLSTPNEEPGCLGARVTGPTRVGLPPHLPGTSKMAATTKSSWCREEAGYPQSMHHLETVEKAGRMRRYKVASSRLATLLRFCRHPEQSAVNPLLEGEEGDAEELW